MRACYLPYLGFRTFFLHFCTGKWRSIRYGIFLPIAHLPPFFRLPLSAFSPPVSRTPPAPLDGILLTHTKFEFINAKEGEAVWRSGYGDCLEIKRSQVQDSRWPLVLFVPGSLWFNFSSSHLRPVKILFVLFCRLGWFGDCLPWCVSDALESSSTL